MNRNAYMADEAVAGFVRWFRSVIVAEDAFTQVFVPRNGRARDTISLSSFREAVMSYNFSGNDLSMTQVQLAPISRVIRRCLNDHPDEIEAHHELLIACLETLVWGGVTVESTVQWLATRAKEGRLAATIKDATEALLEDDTESLEIFRDALQYRSDSAATKIFAMADSRSVIYDNRVGATLAKLVCEYLDQSEREDLPETLAFMVNTQDERRDPSEDGRRFTRKQTGYSHAMWNQRANWIAAELVSHDDVCQAMRGVRGVDPVRALEAALFVMGDDVRTLRVSTELFAESENVDDEEAIIPHLIRGWEIDQYCVPTSYNFGTVISCFHAYRQRFPESTDLNGFVLYLMDYLQIRESTAKAYCFPLRTNQFSIVNQSDEVVRILSEEPASAVATQWLIDKWQAQVPNKTMFCTRSLGYLYESGFTDRSHQQSKLIEHRLCGNEGSAGVMYQVGLQFGRHFGLLGPGSAPTARFRTVFG